MIEGTIICVPIIFLQDLEAFLGRSADYQKLLNIVARILKMLCHNINPGDDLVDKRG